MIRSALAALVLGASLSAPAFADTKDPTDVLGSWSFQTKPYRSGQCLMTGTMRLTSHPAEGKYNCELTAVEVCSMWGRSVVLQLEQKTEGLIYVPDNFTLTIQDASRMWGALVSAATAPVEFRRSEDGIS